MKLFTGRYRSETASILNFSVIAPTQAEAIEKFWAYLEDVTGESRAELQADDGVKIVEIDDGEGDVWTEDE